MFNLVALLLGARIQNLVLLGLSFQQAIAAMGRRWAKRPKPRCQLERVRVGVPAVEAALETVVLAAEARAVGRAVRAAAVGALQCWLTTQRGRVTLSRCHVGSEML